MTQYQEILTFWFGDLNELGCADELHRKRWFVKDPAFDREIVERFSTVHAAAMEGRCDEWLGTPHGRLALIVLLDQFSRNMFRGTPGMFAGDAKSLEVAKGAVAVRADRELAFDERGFIYMPFMHSEVLADQEHCVVLFRDLSNEYQDKRRDTAAFSLRYAEQHRDIIARFGRFPHRNANLGRTSTGDEIAFLKQPGSSF